MSKKINDVLEAMRSKGISSDIALSLLTSDNDAEAVTEGVAIGDNDEEQEVTEDDVIEFLIEHPDPTAEDLEDLSREEGYDEDALIEMVSSMASRFVDLVTGGKSNEENAPEEFDPEQIKMGTKVEREHTDHVPSQEKIARDHLAENPKYYDYLELMEKLMDIGSEKGNDAIVKKFKEFVDSTKGTNDAS